MCDGRCRDAVGRGSTGQAKGLVLLFLMVMVVHMGSRYRLRKEQRQGDKRRQQKLFWSGRPGHGAQARPNPSCFSIPVRRRSVMIFPR